MTHFRCTLLPCLVLILASCSVTDQDIDNPADFLNIEASATVTAADFSNLKVNTRITNRHPLKDITLFHNACSFTVILAPVNNAGPTIYPNIVCPNIGLRTVINANSTQSLVTTYPIYSFLGETFTGGEYEVTAISLFENLEQIHVHAGSVFIDSAS
ncbi:MAG: hypothetical protein AB8G77_02910 [Rhodothermales bacterium]